MCDHKPIQIDGQYVCVECGEVLGQVVDLRGEWRDPALSRTGLLYANTPIAATFMTFISHKPGRDAATLIATQRAGLYVSVKERRIVNVAVEIERLGNIMGMPRHIRQRAKELYIQALNRGDVRCNAKASAAAALYLALKTAKMPRSFDEFKHIEHTGRCLNRLAAALGMKVGPTDSVYYLAKLAEALSLPTNVVKAAKEYIKSARRSGRTAKVIAAAAVYKAVNEMGLGLSISTIAKTAGTSPSSIKEAVAAMWK
ncbi:MAG: hypothetical protein ACK4SY_08725 [Pyrobaculum sp.]